jgi:hypothetical protein
MAPGYLVVWFIRFDLRVASGSEAKSALTVSKTPENRFR